MEFNHESYEWSPSVAENLSIVSKITHLASDKAGNKIQYNAQEKILALEI